MRGTRLLIRGAPMANERLRTPLEQMKERIRVLEEALRGILEIGKRDMSNPKYDTYFEEARAALAGSRDE
jgi:hypothetical protein